MEGRMQKWFWAVPPSPATVPTSSCTSGRCSKTSKWNSFTCGSGTSHTAAFVLDSRANESVHELFKSRIPIPYKPNILQGWKLCCFSKSDILEAGLSRAGPKGWGAWCGAQTLHFSGRSALFMRSWHMWVALPRVGFGERWCLCFSYLSQCSPFILCCGQAFQLIFRSFPERVAPYVAVGFVVHGRKWVQDLSHAFLYHLNPSSHIFDRPLKITLYFLCPS